MRLLVFGGWGQLGSDLAIVAEQHGHELVRPPHGEIDVTDRAGVLAAAQTRQDDVAETFTINTVGARYAGKGARAAGARCVYFSTYYVFVGELLHGYVENDP